MMGLSAAVLCDVPMRGLEFDDWRGLGSLPWAQLGLTTHIRNRRNAQEEEHSPHTHTAPRGCPVTGGIACGARLQGPERGHVAGIVRPMEDVSGALPCAMGVGGGGGERGGGYTAIDSAKQQSKSDNAAVEMLQITQTGCWHVQIHTAKPQKQHTAAYQRLMVYLVQHPVYSSELPSAVKQREGVAYEDVLMATVAVLRGLSCKTQMYAESPQKQRHFNIINVNRDSYSSGGG